MKDCVVLIQLARAQHRFAYAVADTDNGSDSLCNSKSQSIEDTVVLIGAHIDKEYVRTLGDAGPIFEIKFRFALIPRRNSVDTGTRNQNMD